MEAKRQRGIKKETKVVREAIIKQQAVGKNGTAQSQGENGV